MKLKHSLQVFLWFNLALTTIAMAVPHSKNREGDVTEKRHPHKPHIAEEEVKVANYQQSWAAGFNMAWLSRKDYGAQDFWRFSPEAVGYYYFALPWQDLFLRLGARFSYANSQPEMPQAARIVENDAVWSVEGGLVRDWYVVPSLSWGAGYDMRQTKFETRPPMETVDDRLNRSENLFLWYAQVGLGLPVNHGLFMLEPILRYETIDYDDRSHWLFGLETTVGF